MSESDDSFPIQSDSITARRESQCLSTYCGAGYTKAPRGTTGRIISANSVPFPTVQTRKLIHAAVPPLRKIHGFAGRPNPRVLPRSRHALPIWLFSCRRGSPYENGKGPAVRLLVMDLALPECPYQRGGRSRRRICAGFSPVSLVQLNKDACPPHDTERVMHLP